jgi:uncharacterized cupredoxin-like copper-binding protein
MFIVAALAALSSVAKAQPVAVTLSEWKVGLGRDTVRAGSVTFRLKNAGKMTHGFYVRGEGVDKGARELEAGQEGSLTVTLKPGTYEVFCPMSDLSHKAAGMSRKLVVVPDDKPAEAKKPD